MLRISGGEKFDFRVSPIRFAPVSDYKRSGSIGLSCCCFAAVCLRLFVDCLCRFVHLSPPLEADT